MDQQIGNFRDFLKLYNQISDTCFNRCTNTFNTRTCESDEAKCVEHCAQRFIRTNHTVMQVFMEVQSVIVQKRIEEANTTQQAMQVANQEQPNLEVVK